MKTICVFCGSSPGARKEYVQAAKSLGATLARRNLTLVYGGGNVGLMGRLASSALACGGKVIGVIPRKLADQDVAYTDLDDLRVVGSMHERKSLMAELADGFIALPGGLGTIEEFFEALTWAQLGIHNKPCGLLNIGGYFDNLIAFLHHAVSEQFIGSPHHDMILISEDPEKMLADFAAYDPPQAGKAAWARRLTSRLE